MSGQAVNSLRLDNVELKGDRPQVCEDLMRGMRNVKGESMGDLLDSYMQVGEFMKTLPQGRLAELINLRRAAAREVQRLALNAGMDGREVGALLGQEFKWRDFVATSGGSREAEAYFATVDQVASENPEFGDRAPIDIGTYVSRKDPQRRGGAVTDDSVLSSRLRNQDYSPVYSRDENNGLNQNRSAVNMRLRRGEYIIDTLGVIPSYIIEEHFREELEGSFEYSGGQYDRNNWDTVVAVVGKKDPNTGEVLYEDEEKTIPVTEIRVASYDSHVGGAVAVDGLVTERNNVVIALQAEVDRKAEELRQSQLDVVEDVSNGYNNIFSSLAAEMGIDMNKSGVNVQTRVLQNDITAPIKFEMDENGVPQIRGHGEITTKIETTVTYKGPRKKA